MLMIGYVDFIVFFETVFRFFLKPASPKLLANNLWQKIYCGYDAENRHLKSSFLSKPAHPQNKNVLNCIENTVLSAIAGSYLILTNELHLVSTLEFQFSAVFQIILCLVVQGTEYRSLNLLFRLIIWPLKDLVS